MFASWCCEQALRPNGGGGCGSTLELLRTAFPELLDAINQFRNQIGAENAITWER